MRKILALGMVTLACWPWPAFAEVKLRVESFLDADPSIQAEAGSVALANVGDQVVLTGVTVNSRNECYLEFYKPDTPLSDLSSGMPLFFVLTEVQAVFWSQMGSQNGGKKLDHRPVQLRTGDKILMMIPSLLVRFATMGDPDAGKCGATLVNMTVHTDEGDLRFDW